MCGLVGWITGEQAHGAQLRRMYIEQALILDMIRGEDATGMYMIPHVVNGLPYYLKTNSDGFAFVNTPEFTSYADHVEDYRAMVGHNRFATKGGKEPEDAHPFQVGDITLVHNGTLRNMNILPFSPNDKDVKAAKIAVDSHLLAYNLNKVEPEVLFKKVDGAYATIWHNARTNNIHVLRNSERPLHFCRSKTQDTVFFASEPEMLELLLQGYNHEHTPIVYPDIGDMYTFAEGSTKPTKSVIERYRAPAYQYSSNVNNNNRRNARGGGFNDFFTGGTGGKITPTNRDIGGVLSKESCHRGMFPTDVDHKLWRATHADEQKLMRDMGYSCHQFLPFQPMRAIDGKVGQFGGVLSKVVLGKIGVVQKSCDAYIYGVDSVTAKNCLNDGWTVQPIGIKFTEGEKDTPHIVICRLIAPFLIPESENWARNLTNSLKREGINNADKAGNKSVTHRTVLPAKAGRADNGMVLGPFGVYIPVGTFLDLSEGGCCVCAEDVAFDDAESMFWLEAEHDGDDPLPVCDNCGGGMILSNNGRCRTKGNVICYGSKEGHN
jgi:hypothetical protein